MILKIMISEILRETINCVRDSGKNLKNYCFFMFIIVLPQYISLNQ